MGGRFLVRNNRIKSLRKKSENFFVLGLVCQWNLCAPNYLLFLQTCFVYMYEENHIYKSMIENETFCDIFTSICTTMSLEK